MPFRISQQRVYSGSMGETFRVLRLVCTVCLGLLGGGAASGQQGQDAPLYIPVPSGDGPRGLATLHVYTNLEQIPTLVLSPERKALRKPVDASQFRISLDSGPLFKPSYVREEGDDPVSLAVVVDATHAHDDLLAALPQAMQQLAGSLRARDRISLYAIDCTLNRSLYGVAPDARRIQEGVNGVLEPSHTRGKKERSGCHAPMQLFDCLSIVLSQLAAQPGWRAVLIVTDGADTASRITWNQDRQLAQRTSTAVFGLRTVSRDVALRHNVGNAFAPELPPGMNRPEDRLDMVSQLSGGVELPVTAKDVGAKLGWTLEAVRARYILEYPRANSEKAGAHSLVVSLLKSRDYVRPTGLSVPIADQQLLASPLTLPSDPSRQPPSGERRPLTPNP